MVINFIFFQVLWFACVLGAAEGVVWPGIVTLLAFLVWQLQASRRVSGDITILIVATIVGILIDTLWIKMGLLRYEANYPIAGAAPIWIVCLWIGFALTINHSLAWLKSKILIAVTLSMVSAPLSYFAGHRFGALEFLTDIPTALFVLAVAWGVTFPALVVLSNRLNKPAVQPLIHSG